MPRIAKCLATLREQVDTRWPNRSKINDGWIGDAAHASRASDHNPNADGVVRALDITHDPTNGVDTWRMAEAFRQNKDQRIKYVISNGRIFSSIVTAWQWRPYNGPNKHAHHIHVSVVSDSKLYDLVTPWKLDAAGTATAPTVKPPGGITSDMRRRMGRAIVDFEARRVNGKITVYRLPANDGGGSYEVAGINDKYHPVKAARLRDLIAAGRADQAEREAIDYVLDYTKPATGWVTDAGAEFYLRDTIFNRGPKGAARILQRAVMVMDDGEIGPTTRAAIAKYSADDLISKLRWAREDYERDVVGYRANFWKGLVSRWDKALVAAREFQKEQGSVSLKIPVTIGLGIFAAMFAWLQAHPILAALIALACAAAVIGIIKLIRSWNA